MEDTSKITASNTGNTLNMTQNNNSTDETERETVPRDQIETALQFLEWSHGSAMRRPWSNEVIAYYQAIDIIEDAMNDELSPPEEINHGEDEREDIKRSREAREEGYAAATVMEERREEREREYYQPSYLEFLLDEAELMFGKLKCLLGDHEWRDDPLEFEKSIMGDDVEFICSHCGASRKAGEVRSESR